MSAFTHRVVQLLFSSVRHDDGHGSALSRLQHRETRDRRPQTARSYNHSLISKRDQVFGERGHSPDSKIGTNFLPSGNDVNNEMKDFTIFVKFPDDGVRTVRHLQDGIDVKTLKNHLELQSGFPSHIYALFSADGKELEDVLQLYVNQNIRKGGMLRAQLHDTWEGLYAAVISSNTDMLYFNAGIQIFDDNIISENEKFLRGAKKRLVSDRAFVALFIASFCGKRNVCEALLSLGAGAKQTTKYKNSALHASASQDNIQILEILIDHNADVRQENGGGQTPLGVATTFGASCCEKRLRLFQWSLEGGSLILETASKKEKFHNYRKTHRPHYKKQFDNRRRSKSAPVELLESDVRVDSELHRISLTHDPITANGSCNIQLKSMNNNKDLGSSKNDEKHSLSLDIRLSSQPSATKTCLKLNTDDKELTKECNELTPKQKSPSAHDRPTSDVYQECDEESDGCSCSARRIHPISKYPFRRISCSNAEEWLKSLPGRKTLDNWYPTLHNYSERNALETDSEKEERRRRNQDAFAKWLQRKKVNGELNKDDGDGGEDEEEREIRQIKDRRAYNKWLEKKKEYFKLKESQKRSEEDLRARNIQSDRSPGNNVKSSFILECTDDRMYGESNSSENSAAFQKWLRQKMEQTKLLGKRGDKSYSKYSSEKQLDAKRRSDLGAVMTYEDWVAQKFEDERLARQAMEENKAEKMRKQQEDKRGRAPSRIAYEQWLQSLSKRCPSTSSEKDDESRRQKSINRWRQRHSKNWKTFDEWIRIKATEENFKKSRAAAALANAIENEREREEKVRVSFNDWVVAKEQEQLKIEKKRLKEEKKRLDEAKREAEKLKDDRRRKEQLNNLLQEKKNLEKQIKKQQNKETK